MLCFIFSKNLEAKCRAMNAVRLWPLCLRVAVSELACGLRETHFCSKRLKCSELLEKSGLWVPSPLLVKGFAPGLGRFCLCPVRNSMLS